MSLTKLLKAPIKLFKKDVISFVIIRRYDLGREFSLLITTKIPKFSYGTCLFFFFKLASPREVVIFIVPGDITPATEALSS